jgi:hypothetical protein
MERTCAGGIEFLEQSFEIGRAEGVRFLSSNEKCLDYVCDYTYTLYVCLCLTRALIMTRSFIPDARFQTRPRTRCPALFFSPHRAKDFWSAHGQRSRLAKHAIALFGHAEHAKPNEERCLHRLS